MAISYNNKRAEGSFFFTPDCEPYYNMALDEWLFAQIINDRSDSSANLRLYSWRNPGITIGYNQKVEMALDQDNLDCDIPVIRRITGGRAIYHDSSEITFSLSMKTDILPEKSRSLSAVNSLVSETIVEILVSCGINAEWRRHSGHESRPIAKNNQVSACFDSVSRYEITAEGRKVAGIAQRRIGSVIIQQGSIKINGISDYPAVRQRGNANAKPKCNAESKILSINEMKKPFIRSFSGLMLINFVENKLTVNRFSELSESVSFMSQNPLSCREFV